MPGKSLEEVKHENLVRFVKKYADGNQTKFARIIKWEYDYFNKIHRGEKGISDELIEAICNKFNLDYVEFFIEDDIQILDAELQKVFLKLQTLHPYRKERIIKFIEFFIECQCVPPDDGEPFLNEKVKQKKVAIRSIK